MNSLRDLDDRVLLAINTLARHTGWLHGPVLAYANYGLLIFAALLITALALARHRDSRRLAAAGWATVATLTAVALNQPVGNAVGEARPYATHPGLLRLASATSDFSFPSDHAVMAGAVAAGLVLVSGRLGLIAVVLAVVMAFARIYIGAHYPWDVAAGLGLGASVAGFGWLVLRRPLVALTAWLRALPLLRSLFAARTSAGVQTLTPGRARP